VGHFLCDETGKSEERCDNILYIFEITPIRATKNRKPQKSEGDEKNNLFSLRLRVFTVTTIRALFRY
jgi:hypothetical protein